jgi:hypothetical protein
VGEAGGGSVAAGGSVGIALGDAAGDGAATTIAVAVGNVGPG